MLSYYFCVGSAKELPSTTSTHFLRTRGIPFQFVDPSEAIDEGDSNCIDVGGAVCEEEETPLVEKFLSIVPSAPEGIPVVPPPTPVVFSGV